MSFVKNMLHLNVLMGDLELKNIFWKMCMNARVWGGGGGVADGTSKTLCPILVGQIIFSLFQWRFFSL